MARSKLRLDQLLVARGLAASRERARALILAGDVTVRGTPTAKAGMLVVDDVEIALRQPDHPWASRGGLKLAHALEIFQIDVTNALALDIGASTGGFTDVLLQRGARKVIALDVGHNQIDWRLRHDPRVVVMERVNARAITPETFPIDERVFDIVTIDVSFISLKHILPAVPPLLAPTGRAVALVKPQFEAGRSEVGKGGIVRDAQVHDRVVNEMTDAARQIGLERLAVAPSPIEGATGNREFLMLLELRHANG